MTEQKKPHISFLIVHYRAHTALQRCVAHIERIATKMCYEIIIADNDLAHPLRAQTYGANVRVFPMGENKGFGAANNSIAHHARGDVLFFLNPDTFNFRGDVETFIQLLDDAQVGMIAPQLRDAQNKHERWAYGVTAVTPRTIILNNLFPFRETQKKTTATHVAWVSGAALALKRTLFIRSGGFDERFFLYYEDVDLCRRIQEMGYAIIRSDALVVQHAGGVSMGSKQKQKQQYDISQRRYIAKYYKKPAHALISLLQKVKRTLKK